MTTETRLSFHSATPAIGSFIWRCVWFTAALLAFAVALSGCDGCSPQQTPGPLRPDEHTRFHVSDRLGSSALVLDHQGEILARDGHIPYGEPWFSWQAADARSSPYRFTGHEPEPTSNSIAIGARHYLPGVGRWLNPDPLFVRQPGHDLERPGERNVYRYAGNSPVTHVDPTGLSIWTKLAKVGGKLIRGASAADAFADNVRDAKTLADPSASTAERVLAGLSLASEVLPVSIGDAKGIVRWGQKALKAAPERRALKAAREVKALPAAPAWRASQSPNPLDGTAYTGKVRKQMRPHLRTGRPDNHGFPLEVDNFARDGKVSPLVGGDGVTRTEVRVDGSYRGKDGHFEWIVEPNKSVNHRQFVPKKE